MCVAMSSFTPIAHVLRRDGETREFLEDHGPASLADTAETVGASFELSDAQGKPVCNRLLQLADQM